MAEEVPVDATLKELMSSLSSLETTLEPLMKHKFADLQEQMAKEPVARARLEILTAYAVHDLMWIYLKMSGVSTDDHPVKAELDRLQGYFGKLRRAEGTEEPKAGPQSKLDKEAADRFIAAAIGKKGKHKHFDGDEEQPSSAGATPSKTSEAEEQQSSSSESELEAPPKEQSSKADDSKKQKRKRSFDPLSGYEVEDKKKSKAERKAEKKRRREEEGDSSKKSSKKKKKSKEAK